MIIERKARTSPATTDPSSLLELKRLLWMAGALYLLASLASYSPQDPSWSTWSTRQAFENWMGRTGSILADALLQAFGLAAFGLVALLGAAGLRKAADKPLVWRSSAALLVSLSLLLQSLFPKSWVPWKLRHAGGALGTLLHDALSYLTGNQGAAFWAIVLTLVSVVLAFRVSVTAASTTFARRLSVWFAAFVEKVRAIEWRQPKKVAAKEEVAPTLPTMPTLELPVSSAIVPIAPPVQLAFSPLSPEPSLFPVPLATVERDAEIEKLVVKKPASSSKPAKIRTNVGPFALPPLKALSGRADSKAKTVDRNWYMEKSKILVEKLRDFGVDGEVVHISPGPVITVYEFKPASGVKIKEIANLSDDLTLALSVLSVRIVAPIPGKPVVGIEIPSPHREMVHFKDIVEETSFYGPDVKLPLVLGRLASGEPAIAGLAAMPHLLVAGSTGTGKSVFINTLICSLVYRHTPKQLKLILVDPKMVELSAYEGIPHLLLPVVVDSRKAALALRWAVEEMERRYALMHQCQVRHVDAYNDRVLEKGETEENPTLPYIVVVIDEYADLMAVVPKEVELSIARLAQKARASGIHLVLATQRPSTDVVTGTIKANFPSRISFRVASSIDSKTILDRTGADRLLGNGDMLFHSAGFTSLKRIQGAYISDADLDQTVQHLRAQGEPEYDERLLQVQEESSLEDGGSDMDDNEGALYDRAVRLVTEKGEASISLIQRHLKIGYNRAASLMEEMEKQGVVGGSSGASKRRPVLVNSL
ncbi:DNA translocase FtsK 4TM domain-containing protein [bacterium]|nr:DNA translocase FtsK 4TM domain-containing protein [bacterium]